MKSALEANQEYVKANSQAPPTHKDMLLKTWAQDTEAMAEAMVHKSSSGGWYALKMDNSILDWYKTYPEAIAAQIAYLNSAAEVGK